MFIHFGGADPGPAGIRRPARLDYSPRWRAVAPLRKGEIVEVRRMAPEDACANEMLVLIRWQGRNLAVPLSQLVAIDADQSTVEAIGDWHYWVAQGYLF
ncbi:MAG: calcium-binding protein [Bryobacteraceae bacterium]